MVKRDLGRHSCWIRAFALPRLSIRAFTVVNGSKACWVPTVIVFSLVEKLCLTSAPTDVLVNGFTMCQSSNEVSIGEADASVTFGEVPSLGVKRNIGTNSSKVGPHNTREVDNRVCGQPNACGDSSVVMQVLQFQLS
ncbi:hypothetical protein HanIR_Chr09g0433131 [Helianthus annuus]|nr:hypothetical protein HanIR_Chr09g0433131 [Helianthus annuus]